MCLRACGSSGSVTNFTPTRLGSVAIPGYANNVDANGGFAYVAAGASDFAVRGTLNLPTGSAGLSSNRVDPEVAVAWSRGLPGRWSLGATVDTRWIRLRHQTLSSPSVSLGARLGPRLSTFLEYGATVGHGDFAVHRIDHGYTWAASRRTQLDASVGVGLSASAPDFFVEAGFCHLF